MLALSIVEHLDVVEHILASIGAGFVDPATDPLPLEQVEEALDHGIIVTVSPSAL